MALSITEAIPFSLASGRGAGSAFLADGFIPDISVAEMPFFLATSDNWPYTRQTADGRRQQIDTAKEPGEQTLSQWWVRDQDSWHRGAGINFYEPGSDDKTQYRYATSYGINPWTRGQITLHKRMDQLLSAVGNNYATGAVVGGLDAVFVNANSSLKRIDTATTTYTGVATPVGLPAVAGSNVLVGSTSGILSGTTSGNTYTTLWTTALGTVVTPYWAKSRIIATQGAKVFDVTLAGGNLDTTTPLWTHPDSNFVWTDVAEAPGGILASGYSNGYGFIYKFLLKDSGSTTPTLGAAIQVAEFPPGEQVYAIQVYLGAFIAIGTSKGVRIGIVDGNTNISYGPLTISTTQPVTSFSARDTYIYAAITQDINGNSGAARIDLSEAISDLRYPWAYDVQVATPNAPQSITFFGLTDRVVLGMTSLGIYRQSTTNYEASGVVTSGWIRYATSEAKLFNRVKIRATIASDTTVNVSTVNAAGGVQSVLSLGATYNTDEDLTLLSLADTPQPYARIQLTLTASVDTLTTPVVQSYQVKATPVPTIQRELRIPLRYNDVEQDRNGVKVGYTGYAFERLTQLEAIENDRSVIIVKDWTTDETYSAQIKSVQVVRTTPPSRNTPNNGGIIYLTVLKLS